MEKHRKYIRLLALLFFTGLASWRLWPMPAEHILSSGGEMLVPVFVRATVFDIENGSPDLRLYQLDAADSTVHQNQLLSILASTNFRSDFRNLLPWESTAGIVAENITCSAHLFLASEESSQTSCFLSFHGDNAVSLHGEGIGHQRIYHFTHEETLALLMDYVITHGEEVN